MPAPFVEGAECALAIYNIEHWFERMGLSLTVGDRVIPVLDLADGFRIDDVFDAEITFSAYHGTETGQGTIASIVTAALNRVAPDDLSWTKKGTSPVAFLPVVFWTKFPLNTWRISSVNTGLEGAKDPLKYTVTIKPKFAAYVP